MKVKNTEAQLIELLRKLPERELSQDLTPLVLGSLKPKQRSPFVRLLLHIRSPRVIIVHPLRLSLAASACALVYFLFLWTLNLPEISLKNQTAALKPELGMVPVTFTLSDVQAQSVYVIGSFNGWQPEGYAMKLDSAKKRWIIEIPVPPGEYEYAFLINNRQVTADPKAEFFKKDGFGSRNSILFVAPHDQNFL